MVFHRKNKKSSEINIIPNSVAHWCVFDVFEGPFLTFPSSASVANLSINQFLMVKRKNWNGWQPWWQLPTSISFQLCAATVVVHDLGLLDHSTWWEEGKTTSVCLHVLYYTLDNTHVMLVSKRNEDPGILSNLIRAKGRLIQSCVDYCSSDTAAARFNISMIRVRCEQHLSAVPGFS